MQKTNKTKFVLKYTKPASVFAPWESALPIGNGEVGALVQGGVRYERVMISDARANWLGQVGVLPDISDKMKEVRRLVDSKNQVMAGMTIEKAFEVKKYAPEVGCPLPICDLVIEQAIAGKHVTNYFRQVNMENEEATVQFTDFGTKIDRSCFVSFANNCLVYEISKEGNNLITATLSLEAHDYKYNAFNGKLAPAINAESDIFNGFITYNNEKDGVNYGVCARVITDSKATFQIVDKKLKIENAEKIVVLMKTYVGKMRVREVEQTKNDLLSIKVVAYDKLFKEHYMAYSKEFGHLELSISDEKETSVDNLLSGFNEGSTLLYEKLYHFAKYLNVCGISKQVFPSNVTGLWSYHYANTNAFPDSACSIPALYSSCLAMDDDEKLRLLVNYFLKYADDLKRNAYRIYKSKGYMVPNKLARETGVSASVKAQDISVVTSGAVIAYMFYDYFMLTKDLRFLKNEALPFMCEVVNFYLNYFYENANGEFVCCPSYSPYGKSKYFERKQVGVFTNCTCDIVAIRALINCIMQLSNTYSITVDKMVEYQNFLNELPKVKTVKGAVAEYYDDENSNLSSGFLHLFSVFGSRDITANSSASSVAPYLNAVVQKIDKGLFAQSLVALGRLAEISAILGQGEAAFNILRYMISNFISTNLIFLNYDKNNMCAYVDGDNYFNIIGNELLFNAITSCFVLDYGNNIAILNGKPSAWKSGRIEGVETRHNCIIDAAWDDKRGNAVVTIKAIKNTQFNLVLFKGTKKVKGYNIDPQNPFIENIKLANNKSITLEIKY